MTPDEEIRRGHEAARIMADPLVSEAFDGIEAGIVNAMKQTKVADHATQHELVLMLQLLARLKGTFTTHMQTGRMAQEQKQRTMADQAKSLMRRVR